MNYILLMITVCILLCVAYFCYKTLELTPEESLCMSIMGILILIFATGLLGDTRIALILIYIIAIIGGVQFITNRKIIWKKDLTNAERKNFFSPALVLWLLIFVYAMFAFKNVLVNNWDELNQWAKSVNYMLDYNKLAYGTNFDGEDILLSSTTFFHYFIAKLSSTFLGSGHESNFYVSNYILWFAAAILPFSGTAWKNKKKIAVYGVVVFLSMHILFVQPYYNIYCDQACAMWAGGLIAWQLFSKKTKNSIILIPMILWNVGLFKNMVGPLFAVIALIVICLNWFWTYGKGETFGECVRAIKNKVKKIYILGGVILLIMPFGATVLWSLITRENGMIRGLGSEKTGEQSNRLILTLKSAFQKIFISVNQREGFPYISYVVFFCLVIILAYITYKYIFVGKIQKIYGQVIILYLIGFPAFWFIMIYAYMTSFSYADSIQAGSMHRYLSDYMMLGLVPLLIPYFLRFDKKYIQKSGQKFIKVVLCGLLIGSVLSVNSNYVNLATTWYLKDNPSYQERERIVQYKKLIKQITKDEGLIYMINQNVDGYFTVVADYELGNQLKRDGMTYYFQDEENIKHIAGLSINDINQFENLLKEKNYKYLWIYQTDDYFNTFMMEEYDYPIRGGEFFEISWSKYGKLQLKLLDNLWEEVQE